MRLFNAVEEAVNQVRDGAAEVVSVSGDVFNQYTDTIGDASEFGEQLVSDGGEPVNYGEGRPDNRKEELPKMVNHVEPKRPVPEDVDTSSQDNIFDVAPGINVDTSSQDNNYDVPPPPPPDKRSPVDWVNPVEPVPKPSEPDNRKEEPPKTSEPATPPARPSGAAEVLKKYTGIIQLGVLAVGIAGTIGAYLWASN